MSPGILPSPGKNSPLAGSLDYNGPAVKPSLKPILPVLAAALISSAAVLGATAPGATPAQVTRGPYLQQATPASVVVRWRTDVATDSRVRYGDAPSGLTFTADDFAPTTEHVVELSGLEPETTYFYAVGTSGGDLAGGDAGTFFVTPPPAGTPRAIRVWVIGDSGTANADARAVRDAYLSFTGTRHTDLWLTLGDNAYSTGTDAEYQAALFDTYPSLLATSVVWPAFGNHDGGSADAATQSGPYFDVFTLPAAAEAGGVASGTEAYYSFDHANVHFVVLDSHGSDRSPGGAMRLWLAADLAATDADWVIATWHHAPYTRGSHDSDLELPLVEMRENLVPVLEDGGVDLVLAGHSHSYERSFLLDGYYGTSETLDGSMIVDGGDGEAAGDGAYAKPTAGRGPHEGAVYVVAGSAGRLGGGALDHPAMVVSLNVLGSVVLDVEGHELEATFLDATGAVADRFTLVKGAIFADGFDSGDTSAWSVVVGGS